jgi:hypothetical protein
MYNRIFRLLIEELPEHGTSLLVVPKNAGETALARYAQYDNAVQTLRSGEPLVAIVRSAPLSSPDEVKVIETSQDGEKFRIRMEIRRYSGHLFANEVSVALVEVELGALASGDYEIEVVETTLSFQDIEHPENATDPRTTSESLRFEVR